MSQIQAILEPHFGAIQERINNDPDFTASADGVRCTFALVSLENPQASVIVGIEHRKAAFSINAAHAASFGLQAKPDGWQEFFAGDLRRPYQSFWGMLRVLGEAEEIKVLGDQEAFGKHARLWRIVLDKARDSLHGLRQAAGNEIPNGEVTEDDAVTGKYTWIDHSEYGRVKIFYEFAGSGPFDLLFLHTAGSDSRQYHTLMNNKILQKKCTMYAFDLPAHGRSSLGSRMTPQGYALNESSYLECIGKIIKKLRLRNTIVCGASMAGHVCLAAAIIAKELDVHGAIPCEGCDHLPFTQPIYEIKGADVSLLDPERVCGMCSPTSPDYYKKQIWWQYSSQGYGIFSGDLKFYFRGWDGRDRIEKIDTTFCPVYMLTGEYDYSCTTEASRATADKIPSAVFEAMPGLGHFPLTEDPPKFLPYLLKALDHIQQNKK